jgi:hypothetical protein
VIQVSFYANIARVNRCDGESGLGFPNRDDAHA